MCVGRHNPDKRLDRAGQGPLRAKLGGEILQLFGYRQLPKEEKVRHFLKGRLLSQITDRIPSVPQAVLAFVDLAERALPGDDSLQARRVSRRIALMCLAHIAHAAFHPAVHTGRNEAARRAAAGCASCPGIPAGSREP